MSKQTILPIGCRSFFSELERKKEAEGKHLFSVRFKEFLQKQLKQAKDEMEAEISSGLSGRLLKEDSLQPPEKRRAKTNKVPRKRDREDSREREDDVSDSRDEEERSGSDEDPDEEELESGQPGKFAKKQAWVHLCQSVWYRLIN